MRKLKNFIGNLLIGLAAFIGFLRNVMFFTLTVGLVFGILAITMIALFELLGRANPNPSEYGMPIVLFKKWYWDVIVVFIGGATMWQGITKMFEGDKKEKLDVGKGWGNQNYNYGNKKL